MKVLCEIFGFIPIIIFIILGITNNSWLTWLILEAFGLWFLSFTFIAIFIRVFAKINGNELINSINRSKTLKDKISVTLFIFNEGKTKSKFDDYVKFLIESLLPIWMVSNPSHRKKFQNVVIKEIYALNNKINARNRLSLNNFL